MAQAEQNLFKANLVVVRNLCTLNERQHVWQLRQNYVTIGSACCQVLSFCSLFLIDVVASKLYQWRNPDSICCLEVLFC